MQETAGPGCQQRLMSTLDTYFQAIMQQADDRGSRNIPELEEYITLRRDTSGCKTGFAFIEYAARIDLPEDVIEHPIIKALSDATNDLVSWANVSVARSFPILITSSSRRVSLFRSSSDAARLTVSSPPLHRTSSRTTPSRHAET